MVQSSNQNRHLDIFQGTSTHRERGNHQKSIWKSQHLRHLRATHSCDFPSSRFYFSLYLLQIAIVVPPFWLLYCMSGFDRPFWIYQNWNEFKFVYHSPFFFFDFFVSSGKLWKNISRTSTLDLSFEYMLSTYNIGSKLENCSVAVSLIPKSCDSLGHKHHQHIPCHKSLVFFLRGGRCRHTFNTATANVFSALVSCFRFPWRFGDPKTNSHKTPLKSKRQTTHLLKVEAKAAVSENHNLSFKLHLNVPTKQLNSS